MSVQSVRPKDLHPDPLLTKWSVEYGTGGAFVSDIIAPVLNVERVDFKYPTYKSAKLEIAPRMKVAPGDKPNVSNALLPTFTTTSSERRALDAVLNHETMLANVGPLASERAQIERLTHLLKFNIEDTLKGLLSASTNQTTVSTKWDAANPTIEKNWDDAIETFTVRAGVPPTHAIMGRALANVVKRDPTLKALRKRTDESLLTDGQIPDSVFGLRVLVPGALTNSAAPGVTQSLGRLWSDDNVYLVHVNPAISSDGVTMTSLAQARYAQYGQPFGAYTWEDPHRSRKVTWVSVDVHQVELTICADAIQVIYDCLT